MKLEKIINSKTFLSFIFTICCTFTMLAQKERFKTSKLKLDASKYHNLRGGIRNSFIKFEQQKKGRVAFVGGSITYNGGWRDSICNYLKQRFPTTKFEFIAAGISSMGSTPAAFRINRDVLNKGSIDLLFEEAAVNDELNGRTSEEQVRAMEGIVRHVREKSPTSDIVLMHFVNPKKMEVYRNGKIPIVIQNHEKVARHYNIPSINLAKEVTERIDYGEFTWKDDFINLHPSPFGQGIYSNSIKQFLENAWQKDFNIDEKIISYKLPNILIKGNYNRGDLFSIKKYGKQKGWKYTENWKPSDGKSTRENYTNVPMLLNDGVEKTLKFKFKGDTVGIAIAAGPDAGIIACKVDNGLWVKHDLYTKWSAGLHLPWYKTLVAGLDNGKHTLKIKVLKEKNPLSKGNACRIRYFYVNGEEN
ncbi:SGNH/GDSL hydrolase family protein [Polaribacter cellanae]|uniref:SGNH/GDSL hydrolase family protein n=1 Tax=Polaribacter cellanae TaxID=2818493 RepID=A0A975CP08_9FLAO|nr:SGNH/GDSL hydrolase family protein [Polaribacter cellanae]QTE22849.1 SGNH/GDSL hydrolase family protein [Polaribacter cellanae]